MHSSIEKYYGDNTSAYYALYYSALDNFLLIETRNIFILEQVAKVLSSKIATAIIILPLDEKHPLIKNDTLDSFGLNHQKYMSTLNITHRKHSPLTIFLHHSKLIKRKIDLDESTKQAIDEIKKYATFCQTVLHAINLSYLLHKHFFVELERQEYEQLFLKNQNKNILNPVEEVMNILYFADSEESATQKIYNLCQTYIDYTNNKIVHQYCAERDIGSFLELFYKLSNLNGPHASNI